MTLAPARPVVAALGLVGGGQLAKLTAQAATQLGCEVAILEREADVPGQAVDTHFLLGDWNDPALLLELARHADVVTLENEFVEVAALEALERAGHRLLPASATLRRVQDKLVQKATFAAAGLPLPPHRGVESPAEVLAAGAELGWPLVLKRRRLGYDGRGNATLRGPDDVSAAWTRLGGAPGELLVEAFCDFAAELAVIVVRGQDGALACYPVVETVNREHVCHVVRAPADVPPALAARTRELACAAVRAVDGVGAFGLEFFLLRDGTLRLNEIAPRVHNTGHYTIEACACSQFENHVRAVLGWPLGDTALVAPAACMVNLLGEGPGPGTPQGLARALAVPGAHVHVYGKRRSAAGRKMGHVTALGDTPRQAEERARAAAACLRFGAPEAA